jgi:chitinase
MDDLDEDLFTKFTNVKRKNSGLKTIVAVGGWTFNDNGTRKNATLHIEGLTYCLL